MRAVAECSKPVVALAHLWWVYVLVADDAPTYVGMTHDVPARLEKHRRGQGGRFTRRSSRWTLLGALPVGTRGEAVRIERRVKRWPDRIKRLHFEKYPWLDPAATPMPASGALAERIAHLEDSRLALEAAEHYVVVSFERSVPQLVRFLRNEAWPEGAIASYLRELIQRSPECFQYAGADAALTARAVRGVLGLDNHSPLEWGMGW